MKKINMSIFVVILLTVLLSSQVLSANTMTLGENGKGVAVFGIGDSLTAGMQDVTCVNDTQKNGWLKLVADMLAKVFSVHYEYPAFSTKGTRLDADAYPTNLAAPGFKLEDVLATAGEIEIIKGVPVDIRPYVRPINELAGSTSDISPLDSLLTMLDHMKEKEHDRLLFVWLGANDALFNITRESHISEGVLDRYMTPPKVFERQYGEIMSSIMEKKPEAVFAMTIPDVTRAGYYLSPDDLSFFLMKKIPDGTFNKDDLIPFIIAVEMKIKLNVGTSLEEILKELTASDIFDGEEQRVIRHRIEQYNDSIIDVATRNDIGVIDMNATFEVLMDDGIRLDNGKHIHRSWSRGGLFSLDGVHPSNTGHAIIANAVIERINSAFSIEAPLVDLVSTYLGDPYHDMDGDGWVPGPNWHAEQASIASILRTFTDKNDGQ
jgi:lysophospholipase L1-like esterase